MTAIDPWFLEQLRQTVEFEKALEREGPAATPEDGQILKQAKRLGISDVQIAGAWKTTELDIRKRRKDLGIAAVFNRVDTCSAGIQALRPTSIRPTKLPAKRIQAVAKK